jgi:DNA polymerase V
MNKKKNVKEIFSAAPLPPKSPLPSFLSGVKAGFPSPADDYVEKLLDLNELMVKHPVSTFFVKVEGDSMEGAKIFSGDILVVDRSLEPVPGKIVVAVVNGEFTVKKIMKRGENIFLVAENKNYPPLKITQDTDFLVWGVVTWVIHKTH